MDSRYKAEVDGVSRAEWSGLLALFDDANLYQSWDFAAEVYPRQRASRLVVRRNGEAVGIAQARVATVPLISRGVAHVLMGPLWRRRGSPADPEVFRALLAALHEEFVLKRRLILRVAPLLSQGEFPECAGILVDGGFARLDVLPYRTIMVDIGAPMPEIRKEFRSNWRNHLSCAERAELEIRKGTSLELYDEFLNLYSDLRGRKSFDTGVDPVGWRPMQAALPESEKLLILVAYHAGRAASSIAVSRIGNAAVYLLGASAGDLLKTQASYLLQWRAIECAKEAGCSYYDLGGIDPQGNPGVYHFKTGLGGADVSFVGTFESAGSALAKLAFAAVGRALRTGQSIRRKIERKAR